MFAKLYETDLGQILVKKDEGKTGPEVRFFFKPEDLGVCSVAVSFDNTEDGRNKADVAFEKIDKAIALDTVLDLIDSFLLTDSQIPLDVQKDEAKGFSITDPNDSWQRTRKLSERVWEIKSGSIHSQSGVVQSAVVDLDKIDRQVLDDLASSYGIQDEEGESLNLMLAEAYYETYIAAPEST